MRLKIDRGGCGKKKTFKRKEGSGLLKKKKCGDKIDQKIYPLPKPSSNQLVFR